jgi:hypothetical protein
MPERKSDENRIGETKAKYRPRKRTRSDRNRKFPRGSFWNSLTLDELIKQQGTKPFDSERLARSRTKLDDEEFEAFFRAAVGDNYRPKHLAALPRRY